MASRWSSWPCIFESLLCCVVPMVLLCVALWLWPSVSHPPLGSWLLCPGKFTYSPLRVQCTCNICMGDMTSGRLPWLSLLFAFRPHAFAYCLLCCQLTPTLLLNIAYQKANIVIIGNYRSILLPYLEKIPISQPVSEQSDQWNLFHGCRFVHTHLWAVEGYPRFVGTCGLAFCLLFVDVQTVDPTLQSMEAVVFLD